MTPLVSVVIPSHNSSKYISQTIDSVLLQTYKEIEVIIVDDGSTDDSREILLSIKSEKVKLFNQENKGACAARNLGFTNATGSLIQFLDTDDILAPNKIELQVNLLLTHPNYCNKIVNSEWGRFYSSIEEKIKWEPHAEIRNDLQPAEWLIKDRMSMTACWLTPRHLIEKAGLWKEDLKRNQDGEFFSRVISHSDEVLFCLGAKVYYRSGIPTSVSANKSRASAASALHSIDLIKNYLFSLEQSDRSKLAIANKYLDFAFGHFIQYPDLAKLAETKALELAKPKLGLEGGYFLKSLETLFGWKTALRVKDVCNTIFKRY